MRGYRLGLAGVVGDGLGGGVKGGGSVGLQRPREAEGGARRARGPPSRGRQPRGKWCALKGTRLLASRGHALLIEVGGTASPRKLTRWRGEEGHYDGQMCCYLGIHDGAEQVSSPKIVEYFNYLYKCLCRYMKV